MNINSVEEWLGENNTLGIDIWKRKYQFQNETFSEWLDRISFGDDSARELILQKRFIPGGRILSNAGLPHLGINTTYSNCYVLSVEDSIESIYECCSNMARTYSYGGGVGIDISNLRPRGAHVNNSAKETTGAVSFMRTFDVVTNTIGQSGRRGALMISMDVNHPDIEEFINVKANTDQITSANISVRVNDAFMKAVANNSKYLLRWPCDSLKTINDDDLFRAKKEPNTLIEVNGGYIKYVDANKLFKQLVKNNWDYAEPGILYWDKIDHWNLMDNDPEFKYAGVNPCAEEPLLDGSACLLGSMNVGMYVEDGVFNFNKFSEDVKIAVRYLNTVLDDGESFHPLVIQRLMAHKYKAIGLGLMNIAGALIKLKLRYGSKPACVFANNLTRALLIAAFEESCDLNSEGLEWEGMFDTEFYKKQVLPYLNPEYRGRFPRNSQLLTIAPTGSISTMIQCASGGCEPVFAFSYTRTTKSLHDKDVSYKVFIPEVQEFLKENTSYTEETLPEYFVTAGMLKPLERIEMQAALQQNIDASISSTINLAETATEKDVYDLYQAAYTQGLKGITIFRANCKRMAILSTNDAPTDTVVFDTVNPISRKVLGNTLTGTTTKCVTACGTLYITINKDENGNIVEIFTNASKSGTCKANLNGETRMASLALRSGVKVSEVIDQLRGIYCPACVLAKSKGKKLSGCSCPDIIAKTLETTYNKTIKQEATKVDVELCPDCGEPLSHSGGCVQCTNCGYSKCG